MDLFSYALFIPKKIVSSPVNNQFFQFRGGLHKKKEVSSQANQQFLPFRSGLQEKKKRSPVRKTTKVCVS